MNTQNPAALTETPEQAYPIIQQPKFSGFLITCTGEDRRRVGDDPNLARRLRRAMQADRRYQRKSLRRKVQVMRNAMLLTHPSEDHPQ